MSGHIAGAGIKLNQCLDMHMCVGVTGERVLMPREARCTGQGCEAPAWLQCLEFASATVLSTLDTSQWVWLHLVQGVSKQERSHSLLCECMGLERGSTKGAEGAKCVSLSLNVLGTIGLQFLRQHPVALEARLALIPFSTSQAWSKVSAFSFQCG